MTMISHSHKFIFVRPLKVASTSILASLAPLCQDEDILIIDPALDAFDPDVDADDIGEVRMRNAHVFADLAVGRQKRGVHIPPERIRKAVGDRVWEEYFKFTVVRNPWDWFVSLYYYKLRNDWPRRIHDARKAVSPRRRLVGVRTSYRLRRALPNFELGRHKENIEFILKKHWLAKQLAAMPTFYFYAGRRYAAYYIRFENIEHDYDEVCRRLHLPRQSLPKRKNKVRDKNSDYHEYYTDWSREYLARQCRQIIDSFGYRF